MPKGSHLIVNLKQSQDSLLEPNTLNNSRVVLDSGDKRLGKKRNTNYMMPTAISHEF